MAAAAAAHSSVFAAATTRTRARARSSSGGGGGGGVKSDLNLFSHPPPPLLLLPNRRIRSSSLSFSKKHLKCVKATYSDGYRKPEKRGIWSIREDLQVPSSPYLGPVTEASQGQQGPPPMMAERFQSVISQLFQHRIIRCGGPIEDDMANIIVAQLLYLDAVDPNKDIVMYINSPGGSVTAGMAIFDTMRHIRPDVSTVCVGLAASMGAFLLCSGTKD